MRTASLHLRIHPPRTSGQPLSKQKRFLILSTKLKPPTSCGWSGFLPRSMSTIDDKVTARHEAAGITKQEEYRSRVHWTQKLSARRPTAHRGKIACVSHICSSFTPQREETMVVKKMTYSYSRPPISSADPEPPRSSWAPLVSGYDWDWGSSLGYPLCHLFE